MNSGEGASASAVQSGASTAAALTGHAAQAMVRHYRVVTQEDRRAAVEVATLVSLEDEPG
jgi:hypothetical protein